MELYVPDWDRRANHTEKYPELKVITSQPTAIWYECPYNKPLKNVKNRVRRLLAKSDLVNQTPVLVLYAIPNRDLGGYSKGGQKDRETYLQFVGDFVEGIGKSKPIVIFEPDAIPQTHMLSIKKKRERMELIETTLRMFKRCNARVYLDVGHCNWLEVTDAALYLKYFNVNTFAGFSINTSNFYSTEESYEYGKQISELCDNAHFVIDTSRNGNPNIVNPKQNVFNPDDICLGNLPTVDTCDKIVDAYLWIKVPGESDGTKNGGPKAGRFWLEQALELVHRSKHNDER